MPTVFRRILPVRFDASSSAEKGQMRACNSKWFSISRIMGVWGIFFFSGKKLVSTAVNRKNWVKRIYTDRTGDFSIKYVMWNVSRSKPNRSPQIFFYTSTCRGWLLFSIRFIISVRSQIIQHCSMLYSTLLLYWFTIIIIQNK